MKAFGPEQLVTQLLTDLKVISGLEMCGLERGPHVSEPLDDQVFAYEKASVQDAQYHFSIDCAERKTRSLALFAMDLAREVAQCRSAYYWSIKVTCECERPVAPTFILSQ